MPPLQPTTITQDPEEIRERFVRVEVDRADDARWHFRLAVPSTARLDPRIGRQAPTREAPVRHLASFFREDLELDIDVIGALLPREIDPLYWLEMHLEHNGLPVSSMLPLPLPGGRMGDAISERAVGEHRGVRRLVAIKFGPRLFIVTTGAEREAYLASAEDFFIGLTQFGVLDERPGLSAEPLRKVAGPGPEPWRLYVPDSWTVSPEEPVEGQAGFQAALTPPGPDEPPVHSCWTPFLDAPAPPERALPPAETYLGKMAFTVLGRGAVATAEDAQEGALEAFREAGLELDHDRFEDEPPTGRLEESRVLRSAARLSGAAGAELRCRVAQARGLWVIAGVVGPSRRVNPFAWMQNERSLDVVTGSFELGD